jgi:hypothetical protein
MIANELNINQCVIHQTVTKYLNMRTLYADMVTKYLNMRTLYADMVTKYLNMMTLYANIVTKYLNMRTLYANMVTKYFNENEKACHNEVSAEMLQRLETELDFLEEHVMKFGFSNEAPKPGGRAR